MRVHILTSDKTTVELRTVDAPKNAPEWLSVTPGADGVRIIASPPNHPLDSIRGEFGEPNAIVNTARLFLLGDIEQETAEQLIAASIERWCRASRITV